MKVFGGAITNDMENYVKPTLERYPQNIMLHCGINDLNKIKNPKKLASEILELAMSIKSDNNQVMIPGLFQRADRLNNKVKKVNMIIKSKCSKGNMYFIEHENINPHTKKVVTLFLRIFYLGKTEKSHQNQAFASTNATDNPLVALKKHHKKNFVVSYLNVNSVRKNQTILKGY